MPIEIPLDPSSPPVDAFSVSLDGAPYQIVIAYNVRAARWAAALLTSSGAPIFSGAPLRSAGPLWDAAAELAPPGRFVVIALGADKSDPSALVGELGERVALLYYTAAELAELEAL